ncbi:MAG: hypothetical protein LC105_09520 [Chitinophagales bacterium]|nr:hypothetical protein [Chitinophagales bacterium]MCZ2394083.1 hypothetical protein [Chitinophagales bacterium]
MKKQFVKTGFLVIFATLLISCKKNNDNGTLKQQISFMADAIPFTVTTGGTNVEEADAHIRDGNKFQLDATTNVIDFSINNQNVPGEGTFLMNGAGNALNFVQWEDGFQIFSSIGTSKSHFTLTITKVEGNSSDLVRYIEGSFSGVIYNTIQTDSVIISNGQIRIVD